MKTKHFFIVLAAVAVCFTACKKSDGGQPPPEDSDYRSQWVGDWEFVTIIDWSYFDGSDNPPNGSDTIYYLGKISNGDYADELIVKYTGEKNDSIFLRIKEDGTITKIHHYISHLNCSGYFDGHEKNHFRVSEHSMGGGKYEEIINGTKKEGDKK